MEDIEIILSMAGTALGLLITTITFLAKFLQNSKNKKVAEAAQKVAENIIKIGNAVLPFVEKAETFVNYTGAEKKEYVMSQAIKFAVDHNIPFDMELVSNKIEEIVTATKSINARDKDKIAAKSEGKL